MSRNPFSQQREDFLSKQSKKLNNDIDKSQKRFYRLLLDGFINGLAIDEYGILISTANTFLLPSRLDELYDAFIESDIKPIVNDFTSNIDKLLNLNKKYFDSIKAGAGHKSIKEIILSKLGITGAVTLGGSLIYSLLVDRDVIGAIKSVFMGSIGAGLTITAFKIAVEHIVTKNKGGLIKDLFEQTLPDPYVKIDRFIGVTYSTELLLKYAKYQGGVIKTSRDFCIERNNKVFSMDEIRKFGTPQDEFGGYTDKGLGKFQGKTDPYNPIIDLGGYNCRHQLDPISDELAFYLRPDLNNQNPGLN